MVLHAWPCVTWQRSGGGAGLNRKRARPLTAHACCLWTAGGSTTAEQPTLPAPSTSEPPLATRRIATPAFFRCVPCMSCMCATCMLQSHRIRRPYQNLCDLGTCPETLLRLPPSYSKTYEAGVIILLNGVLCPFSKRPACLSG